MELKWYHERVSTQEQKMVCCMLLPLQKVIGTPTTLDFCMVDSQFGTIQSRYHQKLHQKNHQMSHEKKKLLLSMKYWLVNRDPYNGLY